MLRRDERARRGEGASGVHRRNRRLRKKFYKMPLAKKELGREITQISARSEKQFSYLNGLSFYFFLFGNKEKLTFYLLLYSNQMNSYNIYSQQRKVINLIIYYTSSHIYHTLYIISMIHNI